MNTHIWRYIIEARVCIYILLCTIQLKNKFDKKKNKFEKKKLS